jgi:hypothetical protein
MIGFIEGSINKLGVCITIGTFASFLADFG